MKSSVYIIAIAALLQTISVQAARVMIQPTAVDASSSFNSNFAEEHLIDGGGLSDSTIVETGDAVPVTFPTHITGPSATAYWVTSSGSTGWLMYDLGVTYLLEGVHNWNYNFEIDRGIQDVDIKFATTLTGTFGSTDENDASWGSTFSTTFTQAPAASYSGETINFGSLISARYVLFDVSSNYGNSLLGNSETRFIAVPEPSSIALFGLSSLLLLIRRQRK